ncbi:beta strand repeat-containing protein, partial [Undibacterium sp. SXout20W]|uniref:beta strand repeat-containing protein n=1 Tax=Undibacterium sp. SXout20W TaxID=3413051 RepID=UPI003BF13269
GQVTITGVNGQTLNYTGTASAHNANVSANGSNYVSGITGLSNGTGLASNYVLPSLSSYSANNSVTISQATASINAAKTYDSNTSLTPGQVSITGVNGQTLNYTGTAVANNANVAANATNYVSGITGLSDGTGLASNYVLPSQSAKSGNNQATINAVTTAVNIIGNSQSGTYNATQQSVNGFTATGLVGTDTASNITGFTASGATGTNAGSYANTVGGTNSNYSNVSYTNGSLNIGQATATINATKTYDSNTSLTTGQVSITGVNGQTLNYTGTALANNANVSANATNYVSGITGLSDGTGLASNYVLPSQSAKSGSNQATINAVTTAVNIVGNSQSGTYNATQQSVSGFTAIGLVGTDT